MIARMTSTMLAATEEITSEKGIVPTVRHLVTLPIFWVVLLAAASMWLLLPRGTRRGKNLGILCGVVSLAILAWYIPKIAGWVNLSVFAVLALTTIISCAAAITSKNPIYCAIWFGMALLGTAGLFLYNGAQFLSVATITVYAGAILVTFLFVIMLAQPEGHAYYDRLSWEAPLSAATGAILVGLLTATIVGATDSRSESDRLLGGAQVATASGSETEAEIVPTDADRQNGILAEQHVASFGRELVSKHLASMNAAGVLMLAALVGAVAIVSHGKQFKNPKT